MLEINIPYQNHINKQFFDYLSSCCNQLNNVNFADNISDLEAQEPNYVYFLITNNRLYFLTVFSKKDDIYNLYLPLMSTWIELKDINLDLNTSNLIFKFNIKKLFSTLSFSSDYKERNNIKLYIYDDFSKIVYKISEEIEVVIATIIEKNTLKDKILALYDNMKSIPAIKNKETIILTADNVDKNSFLLPYFNHKDCLNFTVSNCDNKTEIIYKKILDSYMIRNSLVKDNHLMYESFTLLRKDKFKIFNAIDNVIEVSSGFWQLLVLLQNNKKWKNLYLYSSFAVLDFDNNNKIYCIFDKNIQYKYNNSDFSYLLNYKKVGHLLSSEIFLFNKLFPNPKNSYFDFSLQSFIGDNYIFDDKEENKEKENKTIKLSNICNNDSLPLNLSLMELKHYIGGDLSQKDFIVLVYFDGINVLLEKWNSDNSLLENCVIFNHIMSKTYLGV